MTSLSTEAIIAIVALPLGLSLSALAIYIAYLQLGAARRNGDQNDTESLPLVNSPEAMLARATWSGQNQVQYEMVRWERNVGGHVRFSAARMPDCPAACNCDRPLRGRLPH